MLNVIPPFSSTMIELRSDSGTSSISSLIFTEGSNISKFGIILHFRRYSKRRDLFTTRNP